MDIDAKRTKLQIGQIVIADFEIDFVIPALSPIQTNVGANNCNNQSLGLFVSAL
jgi:hypothetical protein